MPQASDEDRAKMASWNAKMIIQLAGLRLDEADDRIIALAERCADRFYYLDLAASELIHILSRERT